MQPNCQDWHMFHPRRESRKGCCKEAGVVPVPCGIKVRLWKQMTTSEIRSTRLRRVSDGPGETVWGGGGRLRSRQERDTHSYKEGSSNPARDTGMELPPPVSPSPISPALPHLAPFLVCHQAPLVLCLATCNVKLTCPISSHIIVARSWLPWRNSTDLHWSSLGRPRDTDSWALGSNSFLGCHLETHLSSRPRGANSKLHLLL